MSERAFWRGHWTSVTEAAHLLGVSDRTIRRWIDEGKLRCITLSPRRRSVEVLAVLELMEQHADDTPLSTRNPDVR